MASELVLAPVIDRNALRKAENQISTSMALAGKKGSMEIQTQLRLNVKKGVIKGFDDGMRPATAKMKALGVTVAIAAGAVIHDTMQKTFGSLDENIDRIMGKLDSVRDITRNAEAFGIDSARYAALSVMGSAAGMDQGDIQGIMAGFVASLKDEEMSGFAQIAKTQGTEKAFFDFLSSSAKLDERARQSQLIQTFGEDDFRLVSRFMNPMMQMQAAGQQMTLSSLFQKMTGANLDLGAISGGLARTGQAQSIVTQQQTEQLLKSIISGVTPGQAQAVTAVSASQRTLQAAQMSTLELQVKARIIANDLEVKQIQAGGMAVGSVIDYGEALKGFADKPSVSTYKQTIPLYRMFNPESGGGSILSTETQALLSSGAAMSGATAPMDMVTNTLAAMLRELQKWSETQLQSSEKEDARTYRGY